MLACSVVHEHLQGNYASEGKDIDDRVASALGSDRSMDAGWQGVDNLWTVFAGSDRTCK